jgi:cytochrome c556
MKASVVIVAVGVVLASASVGLAQNKAQVIKDRAALMHHQFHEWLIVRNYLQGKADQTAAIAAAESLSKSVPTVPKYFPPGTEGPGPSGKYAPKPEVWTEHDKFLAADRTVTEQVAALSAALKTGDKVKAAAAFKQLDTCDGCHRTFQQEVKH